MSTGNPPPPTISAGGPRPAPPTGRTHPIASCRAPLPLPPCRRPLAATGRRQCGQRGAAASDRRRRRACPASLLALPSPLRGEPPTSRRTLQNNAAQHWLLRGGGGGGTVTAATSGQTHPAFRANQKPPPTRAGTPQARHINPWIAGGQQRAWRPRPVPAQAGSPIQSPRGLLHVDICCGHRAGVRPPGRSTGGRHSQCAGEMPRRRQVEEADGAHRQLSATAIPGNGERFPPLPHRQSRLPDAL
ncbi:hypothetical protein I4F81_010971 [Pyropia yezoensis]|uniref:Uncharacterized protein n=1 Tax=Pyropia yezoensis TaxID=2788 RepID=A0ACC3CE47_PYRYE|nr:hypothetical protein I4F81_010971 [Neopyropia yezoensis]